MPIIILLILSSGLFAGQKYTICPSGCDFTTAQACEDGNTKNYAGVGKDTCFVRDEGVYIGILSVAGLTNVDANNNLMFRGLGTSKTILRNTSATAVAVVTSIGYTGFEDLQIQQRASIVAGILQFSTSTASNGYINRCFLNISGSADAYGLTYNGAANILVTSSAIVAYTNTLSTWGLYNNSGGGSAMIRNSIVIGFARGYYITGGSTMSANNCIAIGRSVVADFSAGITQTYNISSDASASGTGSLINKTFAETMKADSVHIAKTSVAYNSGNTISGVTRDVDSELFRTTPSIGADEPYDSSDSASSARYDCRLRMLGIGPCRKKL